MRYLLVIILLIPSLSYALETGYGGMKYTTDWAHEISKKDDIRPYNPGLYDKGEWFDVLKKEPIIWGKPKAITYADIQRVQNETNSLIKAKSDQEVWRVEDYSATPSEIISKGAGDCEDFVTMKYYALAAMGAKPSQLNIFTGVYIYKGAAINHTVLVVEDVTGREWIVDIMHTELIEAKDYMHKYFEPKHRLDNKSVSIW